LSVGLPQVEGEIKLKSLKIVEKTFLQSIEAGLDAFNTYLTNEYGAETTFPYVRTKGP